MNRSFTILKVFLSALLIFFYFSGYTFATDPAPLEVTSDGNVNINTVLHLPPQASPPANPSPGDIYFTNEYILKLYAHGKWISLIDSTLLGIENRQVIITSSQTWTVPDRVKDISVILVAGGKSGQSSNGSSGGNGGNAGKVITQDVEVIPGEAILVTIGTSNKNSSFGSYLTAQSGGGNAGTGGGSYSVYTDPSCTEQCVHTYTGGAGGVGGKGYGSEVGS